MRAATASEAIATLRAAVDALLSTDLDAADGCEVADLLHALEVERRRLDAVAVLVDSAAEERRIAGDYADAGLTDLLVARLRLDPREARRRAERAAVLGPRRALTGQLLPTILPATAAALEHGEISAAHADVVDRYTAKVDALPHTGDDAVAVVEQLLVTASGHEPPRAVAQLGETLLARLDPDGTEPRDAELERARTFTLAGHPDGSSTPRGRWTPELTATWAALLDVLAAPQPGADGEPDPRTPGQRRHDAMLDAARRLLRGDLPAAGGVPLTLLVRVRADQAPRAALGADGFTWDGDPAVVANLLATIGRTASDGTDGADCADCADATWRGIAVSGHGGLLPMSRLLPALCEADIAVSVTDAHGGVLAFGRSRRLASCSQRIALASRDGGCCFPGCTGPPAWTEAHHVVPWWRDGPTDLANLCLVCPYHHRNFERLGWSVRMASGVPEWIPPPWVDPDQRPRRNVARHLAEFDFDVGVGA